MRWWSILLIVVVCTACSTAPNYTIKPDFRKVGYAQLKGWDKDNHLEALETFIRSCTKILRLPEKKLLHESGVGGTYGDWQPVCRQAQKIAKVPYNAKQFFERYFRPYQVSVEGETKGTFTGYYEVGLYGSRKRHTAYQNPVYKKPAYYHPTKALDSRAAIENGKLKGKGLELVWLNDPIEVFFLHIQGSGVVWLDDGSTIRIGYDGKNNFPYTAIGKYMIEQGWLSKDKVSAQTIRQWLIDHPYYYTDVMNKNESYVFFREVNNTDGPIGAQGVALTAMRSLAVDRHFIPYGAPIWLEVNLTGTDELESRNLRQLMIAQDTGGAIRGGVRGDIFFGAGDAAAAYAGTQNEKGQYFLLLPAHL